MIRIFVTALLAAHGLVHVAVWTVPPDQAKPAPFDPARSWALAAGHVPPPAMRHAGGAVAWVVCFAYAVAALAVAADLPAWPVLAAMAAVTAVVFKLLWFNKWLLAGIALDAGVLVAATGGWPSSL